MRYKLVGFPPNTQFADTVLAKQYLAYLGHSWPAEKNMEFIDQLIQHHVQKIPWENGELWFSKTINLVIGDLIARYINGKRGGLCYQLNLTFYWLLLQLGFSAKLCLATVLGHNDKQYLKERNTHIVPLLAIDNDWYIADVGWSLIQKSIPIVGQEQDFKVQVDPELNGSFLLSKKVAGCWYRQYRFSNEQITVEQWRDLLAYDDNNKEREATQSFALHLAGNETELRVSSNCITVTNASGSTKDLLSDEQIRQKLSCDYGINY